MEVDIELDHVNDLEAEKIIASSRDSATNSGLEPLFEFVDCSEAYSKPAVKDVNIDVNVAIYKCTDCDKSFKTQFQLTIHNKKHLTGGKPFTCEECSDTFEKEIDLKQHLKIVHQLKWKPFQCDVCDKSFSIQRRLTIHTRVHTGERPYACEFCPETYKSSDELLVHKKSMHFESYACDECSYTCISEAILTSHKRIHNGEKTFVCDKCPAAFLYKNQLKRHNQLVHQQTTKAFNCHICSISLHTELSLHRHLKKSHDYKWSCKICCKPFQSLTRCTRHERSHTGEKSVKCDKCFKQFTSTTSLKQHYLVDHNDKFQYLCDECPKSFREKVNLEIHKNVHTKKTPFECDECVEAFTAITPLIIHKKAAHQCTVKPYECDQCDASYASQCLLTSHQRSHTGELPYPCSDCPKRFKTKNELTKHQNRHRGIKIHECDECPFTFAFPSELVIHKRSHLHPSSKVNPKGKQQFVDPSMKQTFQCDQCEASYTTQWRLGVHLRVHTGERPYKCKKCPKAYKGKDELTRHDKFVHLALKPYKCDECSKTFSIRNNLRAHKLSHTQNKSVNPGVDLKALDSNAVLQDSTSVSDDLPKAITSEHNVVEPQDTHHETPLDLETNSIKFSDVPLYDDIQKECFQLYLNDVIIEEINETENAEDFSMERIFETEDFFREEVIDSEIAEMDNYSLESTAGFTAILNGGISNISIDDNENMQCNEEVEASLPPNTSPTNDKSIDDSVEICKTSGTPPFQKKTLSSDFKSNLDDPAAVETEIPGVEDSLDSLVEKSTAEIKINRKTAEKSFMCESCSRCFATKRMLKIHTSTHNEKSFECTDCDKAFVTQLYLNRHRARVHTNDKPYQCEECSSSFSKQGYLNSHVRVQHNGQRPYKCEKCPLTFFTKQIRERHTFETHHSNEKLQCDICSELFPSDFNLQRHRRKEHQCTHKCKHCNQSFPKRSLLVEHERIHTGARPFKCDECPKEFATKYSLTQHITKDHNGVFEFKCDKCTRTFGQKLGLTMHKLSHKEQKSYQCDCCPEAFTGFTAFIAHSKRVHNVEIKPYVCGECDKVFSSQYALNCHKRAHTGERAHQCELCPKAFMSHSKLNRHQCTVHYNNGKHLCDECDFACETRAELIVHQRIHKGDKNYFDCDQCEKSFSAQWQLDAHIRDHTRERPFKCEYCPKTYKSKNFLSKHISSVHLGVQ